MPSSSRFVTRQGVGDRLGDRLGGLTSVVQIDFTGAELRCRNVVQDAANDPGMRRMNRDVFDHDGRLTAD